MKRLVIIASMLISVQTVGTGLPVVDISNIMQNLLSVLNQLEQMDRMKTRLEFQVRSAQRFARKLNGYKFSNIKDLLRQIRSFQHRARSIGYSYKNIVRQFERTYGKHGSFTKNFTAWEKQSDESIKDAMQAQGLVEHSEAQMQDLNHAVLAKKKAETDSETLQAIGEINALQSKQLNDLKQIIATDARAKHSVIMQERAEKKELNGYKTRIMSDFHKKDSSRPLAYLPSLGSTAPQVAR